MYAILGEKDKLIEHIQKSRDTKPDDAVEDMMYRYRYAQFFAMTELVTEAIEVLEPLLSPPSDASVIYVELDPAFDLIRNHPDFTAMLDRHR